MARSRYALCAAAAILVVMSVFASMASAKPDPGGTLVEGLDNPRGIAAGGGGSVLVAESGNGKLTLVEPRRRGAPAVRTFVTLPVDPEAGLGPVDVAFKSLNKVWAVLSGPPEEGGGDFGRLVRLNRKGKIVESVDIAAHQVTDPDPDDQEGIPDESNPNGLALLSGGGVLVTDAAGNDLLKVDTRRKITTVARFKPELVPWPSGLPFPGPVEPGEPFPVEAVPTAVAIGPDGAWYVSELKGFPFPQGKSRIWRIEPGSVGATCDPANPNVGPCRTVATGFTSVIDLAFGRDGTMYVLEIVKNGLLGVEVFGEPPIGALWAVKGGTKTELATGTLMAPGGVAVSYDGTLNVTTGTVFGPGAGAVVRVRP
ncbi:MAG: ScyD/ScyE family protein [Gaiellaceae bacterium]